MQRIVPVVVLVLAGAVCGQEGKLERIRQEVAGEQETSSQDGGGGCGDDSDEGCIPGWLSLRLLLAPLEVPRLLLEGDEPTQAAFFGHPYAWDQPGYLWIDRPESEYTPPPKNLRRAGMRLSVEDGNDFDGLNRVGGSVFVDSVSRFGVLARLNSFQEQTDYGTDHLWMGELNLTYRFAQHEQVAMYAGVGLRVLGVGDDASLGWSVLYGADYFPAPPLVMSVWFDAGQVWFVDVFHGRGTVGVLHHGWEVFGGWDWLRFGSVDVQGPLIGVRCWF